MSDTGSTEDRRPLAERPGDSDADQAPPSGDIHPGVEAYDTQQDPVEYARSLGDDALADYVDGQPDDVRATLLADGDIAAIYRRVRG